MTAKALSIQQPWAWAITDLDKRVENRSKPTSYRGEVFLHASKVARGIEDLRGQATTDEVMLAYEAQRDGFMALGCIVGVARITDCICAVGGTAKDSGDRWLEGPWAYVLDEVVKLPTPVPCKGALGFWKVPSDVEAEVRRQLEMPKTENVTQEEQRTRVEAAADPAANSPADLGYTAEQWKDFTPDQRRALRKVYDEIEETKLLLGEKRIVQDEAEEAAKDAKEDVKVVREKLTDLREQAEDIAAGRSKGELPGMDNASALGVATGTPGAGSAEAKPTDVCECGHPRSAHEDNSKPGHEGPCLDAGCIDLPEDGCQGFVLRKPDAQPAAPAEDIPADLLNAAMEHVVVCHEKGKGLDANSLSLVLFSNRKKENRPRCEAILARLVRDGLIVADESSDDGKARYLPAGKE